ncbi:MAG: lytic murein transglycosylase, partial [Hyphomonadaceae bacterium]|nr:lytic murein transglycosylase [Hyphomonadaceae bacterium]
MTIRTWRWALAGVAMGVALAACGGTRVAGAGPEPAPEAPPSSPAPPLTAGPGGAFDFASSGNAQFDGWRAQFAAKASAAGRRTRDIQSVLDGLVPVEATAQAQSFDNQAEFVKPIWDYARTAVSPTRIANGQAKLAQNAQIFDAIEASYSPPREIIAAVWGMETS